MSLFVSIQILKRNYMVFCYFTSRKSVGTILNLKYVYSEENRPNPILSTVFYRPLCCVFVHVHEVISTGMPPLVRVSRGLVGTNNMSPWGMFWTIATTKRTIPLLPSPSTYIPRTPLFDSQNRPLPFLLSDQIRFNSGLKNEIK